MTGAFLAPNVLGFCSVYNNENVQKYKKFLLQGLEPGSVGESRLSYPTRLQRKYKLVGGFKFIPSFYMNKMAHSSYTMLFF